jgi:hypothetical protein
MTIAKALSVVTLVGSTLGLGLALNVGCGGSSTPPPAAGGATPAGSTASATDPSKTDSDEDGVFDDVDLCPNQKEDGKGSKPKDGCPDKG